MEKGQILIAKDNFIANGKVWLTKGKEYPLIEHSGEYAFVKRDDGIEDGFDLIKNFDIKPTPSIEFKKGDRVWHIIHGWGKVFAVDSCINVKFYAGNYLPFPLDTKELFFKEQQLDYSRPPWQPKEGEWCWFWNDPQYIAIMKFKHTKDDLFVTEYKNTEQTIIHKWKFCAPCPIEALPPHLKGGSK